MILKKHAQYILCIHENLSYEVRHPDGTPHFVSPATKRCPKLYLVGNRQGLQYVGITNQPMAVRLNMGLKATGTHGYHGYAWKMIRTPLTLDVWCVNDSASGDAIQQFEAVEAEVVYLCRFHTGRWPKSQTEIHFHPPERRHSTMAKKVFEDFAATNPGIKLLVKGIK